MKKWCTLVIISVLSVTIGFAQKAKKIKNTANYNVETVYFDENKKETGAYVMHALNKVLLIEGQYEAGEKVGEWIFYDRKGKLLLRFNFDEKRTLESQLKYQIADADQWINYDRSDLDAPQLGELFYQMYRHFEYPEIASSNGVVGRNIIFVYLNEEGGIQEMQIARSIGAQTGEACMRMLGQMPIKWSLPEPADFRIHFPFIFSL